MRRLFIWIAWTAVLSNTAHDNPILEDLPLSSDLLSENTLDLNDFETSSLLPSDWTTQNLDFSDSTMLEPLEISSLSDSSTLPFDDEQLFADSSNTSPEISLFADSNALLESSCETTDDDFQLYSKRNDDGICTFEPEVDPLPLLRLPDLDKLEEILGSGQERRWGGDIGSSVP